MRPKENTAREELRNTSSWIDNYKSKWRAFAASQERTGDDAAEVRACAEHALAAADTAEGL